MRIAKNVERYAPIQQWALALPGSSGMAAIHRIARADPFYKVQSTIPLTVYSPPPPVSLESFGLTLEQVAGISSWGIGLRGSPTISRYERSLQGHARYPRHMARSCCLTARLPRFSRQGVHAWIRASQRLR
ncbi:hypothetical protein PMIN02_005435 [Paraphaeosphaeria minitans]